MSQLQSVLEFKNARKPTDYVIAQPFKFPDRLLTVELWIKTDSKNAGTPIGYSVQGQSNAFILYNYNALEIYVIDSKTPSHAVFNDGQWHHCALTWDSSTGHALLYKDGQVVFHQRLSKKKAILTGGALVLGQEQDSVGGSFQVQQAFRGQMADVRIWSCARTAQQIKEHMGHRLVGDEAELALYWPLDEGEGDRANDKTPNNNDGVIHGTTWGSSEVPIKGRAGVATFSTQQSRGTGLADYGYWYNWGQSLPKQTDKEPFRRGRIWT